MKIIIDLDSNELNQVQRVGLAALLEAGDAAGTLTVTNTDEPAKEPLKETTSEEAPATPKRRTRKKVEPKPEPAEEPGVIEKALTEALDEGAAEEAANVAASEAAIEAATIEASDAPYQATIEGLEQLAINTASPVIRKSQAHKDKVREVLADLEVSKITELSGDRDKLNQFIERVRAIEA